VSLSLPTITCRYMQLTCFSLISARAVVLNGAAPQATFAGISALKIRHNSQRLLQVCLEFERLCLLLIGKIVVPSQDVLCFIWKGRLGRHRNNSACKTGTAIGTAADKHCLTMQDPVPA